MHRVVETAPSYERKMIEEYRQHTSQIGASATIFGGIVITLMFMLTGSKVPAI